jgi:hypothetical protein
LQPDDLFSYWQQPAIHLKLVTRAVAVIEDVLAEDFRSLIGYESAKICIESEAIIAEIARFCPQMEWLCDQGCRHLSCGSPVRAPINIAEQ